MNEPRGSHAALPRDGAGPPSIALLARTFALDASGAEEVRAASRHVVRFPAAGARTFAVPVGTGDPRAEVAVAAVLAEAGVPAARCRGGPRRLGDWAVTAWDEVPDVDPEADAGAAALGRLAGRLHSATGGLDPGVVAACDPVAAARAQLDRADPSDPDVAALRGLAAEREAAWRAALGRAAGAPLVDHPGAVHGAAVVHGDLHRGNVVVGRDGPVLVDLELAGWGPRAYDAAPTVASVRWYGADGSDRTAFDEAYGADLTAVAEAEGLDEVWALWSTCWAVANRHRSPADEEEAAVRVASLVTGRTPRPWRLR